MFTDVPPSYDFVNRVLTWRFDVIWRKKAASESLKNSPSKILDLCTGTGDLALQIRKKTESGAKVFALDYSKPMLKLAITKANKKKYDDITFIHADVANIPFPDSHFDSVGIAFAFRNLTFNNPDHDIFLKEIYRIIKSGGRFVIVETSQPKNKLLRSLFHFYMKHITSPLGGFLSGNRGAYRYLAHSAINYWNDQEATGYLKSYGFSQVTTKMILGGISAIYVAIK